MTETVEISKADYLARYAKGELVECINTGNRLYARTTIGQAGKPDKFKVVWAAL